MLVTHRPNREPAKDWRHEWQPQFCEQSLLDTAWHQRSSGVAKATRAEASCIAIRLIPMGVWRDWVRSQRSEETGAIEESSVAVVTNVDLRKRREFTLHEHLFPLTSAG